MDLVGTSGQITRPSPKATIAKITATTINFVFVFIYYALYICTLYQKTYTLNMFILQGNKKTKYEDNIM